MFRDGWVVFSNVVGLQEKITTRKGGVIMGRGLRGRGSLGGRGGMARRLWCMAPFLCVLPPIGAANAGDEHVPLIIPFTFSKSALEIDVAIKGVPLHMILDTGVDPSVIALSETERLGIEVDHSDSGEASGFGDGKGATVFPAQIDGITIANRRFGRFEALATDMGGISAGLGRKLDGVLGYSFLADKIVLIDYPGRRLAILEHAVDGDALTRSCRTRWTIPLRMVDGFPVVPDFHFGEARAPVSLDTGSTGTIGLFQSALALPGVRDALHEVGTVTRTGARGEAKSASYRFDAPVGFGPFTLPAGVAMSTYADAGSADTRVANVGNKLLAAMKLKLLLDYRDGTLEFHGDCD